MMLPSRVALLLGLSLVLGCGPRDTCLDNGGTSDGPARECTGGIGSDAFARVEGRWQVVDAKQPGISALTPEQARSWIGRSAAFLDSTASFADYRCAQPRYVQGTMTHDEFIQDYRVSPAAIGVESLIEITTVACQDSVIWPGSLLIHRGEQLVASWDGAFLMLGRD